MSHQVCRTGPGGPARLGRGLLRGGRRPGPPTLLLDRTIGAGDGSEALAQALGRDRGRGGGDGFHPHRPRNTFAVELLLAGVVIQQVSTLLGQSSVASTERYYAPWNLTRRAQLAAVVRKVHRRYPLLLEFTQKKPPRTATATLSGAGLDTAVPLGSRPLARRRRNGWKRPRPPPRW